MQQQKRKTMVNPLDFDKTYFIDKEMIDKVTLWMLRVILKAGGFKKFIDKNNCFKDENVAYFLDIEKYEDKDKYSRKEIYSILSNKLQKLERSYKEISFEPLNNNIESLGKLFLLNEIEKQMIEFVTCLKNYNILETVTDYLGYELTTSQVKRFLGIILDIPAQQIEKVFASDSVLSISSFLTIDNKIWITGTLERKLVFFNDKAAEFLMNSFDDIYSII